MTPGRREARARRLFRILLRLYPGWFRERYGRSMTETFLDAWRTASTGSSASGAGFIFWRRAFHDALTEGLSERAAGLLRSGSGLGSDVRRVLRTLRRRPAFVVLTAATLGLGIGGNVAVLRLVDAVLLRPLPVAEPRALAGVFEALGPESLQGGMAYGTFRKLAARERATAGMALHLGQEVELRTGERAEVIQADLVSGNYFQVLGVGTVRGRGLTPSDEAEAGGARVAVLSHALWTRAFAEDADVIGRTIHLSGSPFTVVGVAPEGFRGLSLASETDVWIPATAAGAVAGASGIFQDPEAFRTPMLKVFHVVARIPGSADRQQVTDALNRVRRSMDVESLAEGVDRPLSLLPARQAAALSGRVDLVRFLALLAGVVAVTFLVACVNVANLLLVRARQRSRELAVRAALGAGRGRLVRELSLEALVLGGVGGVAAILVARVTMALLTGFNLPGDVSVARAQLAVGSDVAVVSLGVGLLSTVLFGLLPAWRAGRAVGQGALRGAGARAHPRSRHGRNWGLLLALQTGLSVMLLVTAALFGRTLQSALATDLGFRADSVAALTVRLRAHGVEGAEAVGLVDAVLAEARAHAGVGRAALAMHVPLSPRAIGLPFEAPGGVGSVPGGMNLNVVTPEYFGILGIPVLEGRLLDEGDGAEAPPVIVVNEAAARVMWPGESAVGKRAKIIFNRDPATVVGVVAQTRYHDLEEVDVPYVYYPFPQQVGITLVEAELLARGPRGSGPALEGLRSAVRAVDPGLPVLNTRSVARQIDQVLAPQRFGATLFGLFSVLTLLISAVGIYGVASYMVAARRRDIGVRMALGARRDVVVRHVLGGTLAASLAGALLGLTGAAALTGLLERFLYGIAPQDPAAFGAALAALLMAAMVAAAIPAWRAVQVDPVDSMRTE